jgi:hypothetical protein
MTSAPQPARPMMLLSQPKPLPGTCSFSSAGNVIGGASVKTPFQLSSLHSSSRKAKHQLTLLKGPERIDFGWWDEDDLSKVITRDYYVATIDNQGSLLWIFQYSNDKRWYLHGIFS